MSAAHKAGPAAKNLLALVEGILKSLECAETAGMAYDGGLDHECREILEGAIADTKKAFKALAVLMVPQVGWMQTTVQDCLDVLNNDDTNSFPGTVHIHLTGDYWEKKIDELLKGGSDNLTKLQGHIDKAIDGLEKCPHNNVCQTLHFLHGAYSDMKSIARTGQLKDLDGIYMATTVRLAKHICGLTDIIHISEEDVAAINFGLEMFAKEAGMVELKKELGKWQGNMASQLRAKHVQETLAAVAGATSEEEVLSGLEKLHPIFMKTELDAGQISKSEETKEDAAKIAYKVMSRWEAWQ